VTTDLDVHLPGIRGGDTQAFAAWLSASEPSLRRGLRSFARLVDVEAVLQEALLRVWQVAPRFVPDGAPNGLLRLGVRIARNLAISEVRRTRSRPAAEEELEGIESQAVASPEPHEPDPLLRRVLARCYELLPDQPRRVLGLRVESAGGSDLALAETLGMRLNTFLQNFGRARRLLGECLRKNGVDVDEGLFT
jgi:RNA polymerase sigma factor (sigma-70 family)